MCQTVGVEQPEAMDWMADDGCRRHDPVADQLVADSHHVQVVHAEQRVAVLLVDDRVVGQIVAEAVMPVAVAVQVVVLPADLPAEIDDFVLAVVPSVVRLGVRTVWVWLLGPDQWMLARAPAQLKEQLFACA